MKKKDLIALVIAVAILLVAGYLVYTQLIPQKSGGAGQADGVKVEVVGSIAGDFDQTALTTLDDATKVRNFAVNIDLTTGLGNQAVFGQ
jgi:hypothetical protein